MGCGGRGGWRTKRVEDEKGADIRWVDDEGEDDGEKNEGRR
ncbi:hypothetical protein chiPu_0031924, partial [Chiloscyllium punctatum]|nr:hypothetical protein [Chiloscyllium punctatum]